MAHEENVQGYRPDLEYFKSLGLTPVTISATKEIIKLNIRTGEPTFILGVAGIGKTRLMQQVANELTAEYRELWAVKTFHLQHIEKEDLAGYIFPPVNAEEGEARQIMMPGLPLKGKCASRGILFLDEANRADKSVVSPAFTLMEDRRIGGYELPEGWVSVLGGNISDGSYMVNDMEKDPAIRRRVCLVGVVPDVQEWLRWAKTNGIHPDVVNFVEKEQMAALYDFDSQLAGKAAATPATWEKVSDTLKAIEAQGMSYTDSKIEHIVKLKMSGNIGSKKTSEFFVFVKNNKVDINARDVVFDFEPGTATHDRMHTIVRNNDTGASGIVGKAVSAVASIIATELPPPMEVVDNIGRFAHFLAQYRSDTFQSLRSALFNSLSKVPNDPDHEYRTLFNGALSRNEGWRDATKLVASRMTSVRKTMVGDEEDTVKKAAE